MLEPQKNNSSKYIKRVAFYLLSASAVVVCMLLFLSEYTKGATFLSLVTSLKIISLVLLVVVDFPLQQETHQCPQYIKYIRIFIALFTMAVILYLSASLFLSFNGIEVNGEGNGIIKLMQNGKLFANILSISPLFIYAISNFFSYLYEKNYGSKHTAAVSLYYFCIADLPCILPVIFTILLSLMYIHGDAHVFISGAMAMFIFTSNILTICVEHFVLPNAKIDSP